VREHEPQLGMRRRDVKPRSVVINVHTASNHGICAIDNNCLYGQRHFVCHAWRMSLQSRELRPRPPCLGGAHDCALPQRAKKSPLFSPPAAKRRAGRRGGAARAPPVSAKSLAPPRQAGWGPDTDKPSIDKPIAKKSGAVQLHFCPIPLDASMVLGWRAKRGKEWVGASRECPRNVGDTWYVWTNCCIDQCRHVGSGRNVGRGGAARRGCR